MARHWLTRRIQLRHNQQPQYFSSPFGAAVAAIAWQASCKDHTTLTAQLQRAHAALLLHRFHHDCPQHFTLYVDSWTYCVLIIYLAASVLLHFFTSLLWQNLEPHLLTSSDLRPAPQSNTPDCAHQLITTHFKPSNRLGQITDASNIHNTTRVRNRQLS